MPMSHFKEVEHLADGKVTILTALDATGVTKGIEMIKSALAALAVGGIVQDIIDTGATFDKTMSEVQAISGATAADMDILRKTAEDMGATSAFSASEAASAMTYMSMAGWKAADMTAGLSGIMDLAAASGTDLATTSDIVTDALTAFGLAASDSSHFANVLATTSSSANTTVEGLGESFKYVGAVAGALGYSVEDVSVALGLMANAGVKGGQAGTGLRAALNKLIGPTKEGAALMDQLGISMANSDGTAKSLSDVIGTLRTSFATMSETQQAEAAATLFGTEAMAGMLAIINASEADYQKLTEAIGSADEAYDGLGSAAGMANTMLDNFDGAVVLLQSAMEGFKLAVWNHMSQPLTDLVRTANDVITELTIAFREGGMDGLTEAGMNVILTFAQGIQDSMPQVASKAGEILSYLMQGIQTNVPVLLTAAVNTIASFVSGIASQLPQLIPQGLQMILTLAKSLIANIPTLVSAGIDLIAGLVQGIVNSIPLVVEQAPRIINDFWDAFDAGAASLIGAGLGAIANLAKGIIQNIPLIIKNAGQIVSAILNTIMHLNLLKAGQTLIKNLGTGIKTMSGTLKTQAKQVGQNALNAIKQMDWRALGRTVITLLVNGLKATGNLVMTALRTVGTKALNAFKSINWVSIGTNIITGIVSGITGGASRLFNSIKNLASNALSSAKKALGINSPSKAFRDAVGRWIPSGIAVGIDENSKVLSDSITHMSDDAISGAAEMADKLSGVMQIQPEMADLGQYYSRLLGMLSTVQMDVPVVRTSVLEDSTTVKNNVMAMDELAEKIITGVKEGNKELIAALSQITVDMDARPVAKILAPYIDEFLGE